MADFSAEQQFMIWRAKAGLRPGGTALDAAAGIRTGVWEDLNLSPCPAAIVVGDKRILIQCNMTGGYRRFDCEYRKSPMTPPPEFARQIAEHREPAEPERPTGDPASLPSANQAAAYSVADEIRKFGRLRGEGIITDAEFDAKKAQLLARPARPDQPIANHGTRPLDHCRKRPQFKPAPISS